MFSTAPAAAADTEAMTSNALILKPLILTKQSDLSFGSIIPSGTGDFVAIDADDGSRSSATAGLLPADPGYRARFASSGLNNQFVVFQGLTGMTELNGKQFKITFVDDTTFKLDGEAGTADAAPWTGVNNCTGEPQHDWQKPRHIATENRGDLSPGSGWSVRADQARAELFKELHPRYAGAHLHDLKRRYE